jgi:hypothetical protein
MAVAAQPPQIAFIDFPAQIKADGKPVDGLVGFSAPDGDIVRADFKAIQAQDFKDFSIDLTDRLKGQTQGTFDFQLATTTPQQVVYEVTLGTAQSLRSDPKQFSFDAVGGQPPPSPTPP